MKRTLFVGFILLVAGVAVGQQSAPPDLSAGLVAQAAYKGWLESQISSLWNAVGAIPGLQSATANLPQDEGNIAVLQQQHLADATAITAMQSQIAVMQQQIQILQQGTPPPALAAVYALGVSQSPDRSNPINLNGATVAGSVYIYSAAIAALGNDNPSGIVSVSYWLDNPAMTGAAMHVENGQPWDFQGGTTAAANPWNSASVPNGQHTLTQKLTFTSGSEVDTAAFMVAN